MLMIDTAARTERNASPSLQSVGELTIVTAFSAYLLWSWPGVFVTLAWIFGLYCSRRASRRRLSMAMYRASKLDPRRGDAITQIVAVAERGAALAAVPDVYIIRAQR